MYNDNLKDQVKRIGPAELESRGVIAPARKSGTYICPICGNGTGSTGDGLVVYDNFDGYQYHCYKNGCHFDNIALLGLHYSLDPHNDFPEILKRAAADFGLADGAFVPVDPARALVPFKSEKSFAQAPKNIATDAKNISATKNPADTNSADFKKKYLEIVLADINSPDDNLDKLIEGDRRGLSIATLRRFHCLYLQNWANASHRAEGREKLYYSPRLIIPTTSHYVAVLVNSARNADNKKYQKIHNRPIETFGLNTVTADVEIVFVFEGEIDAMSAWQVFKELYQDETLPAAFIASGSASTGNWVADLDKIFTELDICPLVAVVFDNDDAGKSNAQKRVNELHAFNLPAASFLLSADKEKVDANDFLTRADLSPELLFARLQDFWSSLMKNYSTKQAELLDQRQRQAEKILQEEKAAAEARAQKDLKQVMFSLKHGDMWNAQRIFAMHGKIIRYDRRTGNWYIWNKQGFWEDYGSDDSALLPLAAQVAKFIEDNRPQIHYVKNSSGGVSLDKSKPQADSAEQAAIADKLARDWQKRKTQSNAIYMLKGVEEIFISAADLDKHPMLLNVKNGVVDLATGKLYPAAPELLMTKQANFYYDVRAECIEFVNFLAQIIPDDSTRAAVMLFLGYCLTGSVKEQKLLFVKGTGGNGKGTLFGTILKLLGSYAVSFNLQLLLKQKGSYGSNPQSATPEFAKLDRVRFAYAPEVPEGSEWNISELKAKTGGDRFTARDLFGSPKEIDPQFKIVVNGNYSPKISNAYDVGVDRRLLTVELTQSFTGGAADFELPARLQAQASLNGIGMLLIKEARAWCNGQKLFASAAMKASKEEYQADNDFIAHFIDEHCEEGGEAEKKAFLARLKDQEYQARKFTDRELTAMIKRIPQFEGVRPSNSKYYFKGFHLTGSDVQTSFPE